MRKRKATREERLAQIDDSVRRWQRRLTRAVNAMAKLERERRRLMAAQKLPSAVVVAPATEGVTRDVTPVVAEVTNIPVTEVPIPDVLPGDDLAIPAFLQRSKDEQQRIDDAKRRDAETAAKHKAEAEEKRRAKARGRIAKMQAKRRGDLGRMPLQGKAALEAIKRGSV